MNKNAQDHLVDNTGIIKYTNDGIQINLKNILTPNKMIYPRMVLLKIEDDMTSVVKVKDVIDGDGLVTLKLENLENGEIEKVSHLLDREFNAFKWYLISYNFFFERMKTDIISGIKKKRDLLEFDF